MCSYMIAACLSLIFRPVTTEQVMYVKEDLIIPQVRTIYWSLEGGGRKNGVRLVISRVKTRNSEAQTLPMIQKNYVGEIRVLQSLIELLECKERQEHILYFHMFIVPLSLIFNLASC